MGKRIESKSTTEKPPIEITAAEMKTIIHQATLAKGYYPVFIIDPTSTFATPNPSAVEIYTHNACGRAPAMAALIIEQMEEIDKLKAEIEDLQPRLMPDSLGN